MNIISNNAMKEAISLFLADCGISFDLRNSSFQFNSPFISDSKSRCCITVEDNGDVWWNDFKARGNIDSEKYKGSLYWFIKLVKDFSNINEAKLFFLSNYISLDSILAKPEQVYKEEEVEDKDLSLPEGVEKLDLENLSHLPYVAYLKLRNLEDFAISTNRFYVNKKVSRILFPIYNRAGKLVFYTQRDITGRNPIRWLKSDAHNAHPVYNIEKKTENVFIFEGILDALRVRNGIAILGSFATSGIVKQIKENNYNRIYIVLDNDVAGAGGRLSFISKLKGHKISIFDWSQPLVKKFKDFSDMPAEIIDEILGNKEKYFIDDALKFEALQRINNL